MDPTNKMENTGIIKKLHNMQWLKNNFMSGHSKDKAAEEPTKNMNLENSAPSPEDMPSTSKTADEASVTEVQAKNMWTKTINAAQTLFPDVPSLAVQRLDEEEMFSLALVESIMTAQLEAIKLKEAEKEMVELERKTYSLIDSDSEEDDIWDKPVRRNVPTDDPETTKVDTVKKQDEEIKHKTENLSKHVKEAELQVKNEAACTITQSSEENYHKEEKDTNPDSVTCMVSNESQKNGDQKESSVIVSKELPKGDKVRGTSERKKQSIKNNNDFAKHDKKPLTTREKQGNTFEKSTLYSKSSFNKPTDRSYHFAKREESRIRPNNGFSTTYKPSTTEYRYSGSTRKREMSQNRQREAEDIPTKDSSSFYMRNDAARVLTRGQPISYKKYDTRYILKQGSFSNEGTSSEPKKNFSTSYVDSALSENAPPVSKKDSVPQKLMLLNDKLDYEHYLPESGNQQSDANNNDNRSDKIIKSMEENCSLSKDIRVQEQPKNLARQSNRPSSVMMRARENIRDDEGKNSKVKNNSQTPLTPRPILARNVDNNDVNIPSEMLRCQNIQDNIQRPSGFQSCDVTPADFSYDIHNNNRHTILPSAAVCQEIYNNNHPTVSPPPGFYHQQTFPLSNQWNAHTMTLQPQNSGPMCGNYLPPQQFSCPSHSDLCFPEVEAHQQTHAYAVPCGQAMHLINPIYGSCYTVPANMYEDVYRNSQSDAANNQGFLANGRARGEMRSRETQDIRIGIDVRMNRYQNVYVPEPRQQQNFLGVHTCGNLLSNTLYNDGSRRSDQLNQASNAIMRLNYQSNDGAVDFSARVNAAEDTTSEMQGLFVNPREYHDSVLPSRRMGVGRGRLRSRDV